MSAPTAPAELLPVKVFEICGTSVPAAPAEPHPHDLELVRRWQALLTEPVRLFLREHNFSDVYLRKNAEAFHEINETWRGAKFEFDDPELQGAFHEFLTTNSSLCRLLIERTYVLDTNVELAGPKTTIDEQQGMQESTFDAISRLNGLATSLAEAIDEFDRSLHPDLSYALLRMFLEESVGNQNQLLVTTHDATLLGRMMLRPDEVLFVEKQRDQSSRLLSLDEYKGAAEATQSPDLLRDYLNGRFGGVPVLTGVLSEGHGHAQKAR